MVGRAVAGRIRCRRIAEKGKGLTPAAAEIDIAPLATATRLLHPVGAAIGVEGWRRVPDIRERVVTHGPEFEARNCLRRVARQYLPRRGDIHELLGPAAHAGFRVGRVIIRDHEVNDDLAAIAFPQRRHFADRLVRVPAARYQRGAIGQWPSIILRMRDFESASAERGTIPFSFSLIKN